jgi:hypothetical protein
MAFRLFFLLTRLLTVMGETASIARHTHDIINPHPACKQCYCQKEAYDENGNHHEHPGDRLKPSKTESLEGCRAADSNQNPPECSMIATCE